MSEVLPGPAPVAEAPAAPRRRAQGLGALAGIGVGLSITRKLLMLAYSVLFVRLLGVDLYALFVAFDTVARPLGTVGAVGGANVLIKEVAEARQLGDERRAAAVVQSATTVILLAAGAIALVVSLAAPTIARWMGGIPHLEGLLRIGSVYIVLVALSTALSGALTGYGRTAAMFTLVNAVEPALKLLALPLLALVLAWTAFGWPWVVIPEALSMLAVVAVTAALLRGEPALRAATLAGWVSQVGRVTSLGLPLLVHNLSSIAFIYTDRAMVAAMMGDALTLSVYSVTVTLSGLIILFHRNLVTAVSPAVSAAVAAGDRARVLRIYQHSSSGSFILAGVGYLMLLLFGREVLSVYDPRFAPFVLLMGIMAWGSLVDTFAGAGGYLLIARGRGHWLMYNSIGTVVLNVALNYFLIRRFGVSGAAAATAISYVVKNLIIVIQNYRLDGIHPLTPLHVTNFVLLAGASVLLWDISDTTSLGTRVLIALGVMAVALAALWKAFPEPLERVLRRFRGQR
jgi:O-antigen/teichoic acid export membrane protein